MARLARGDEFLESAIKGISNATTVEQLRQAQAVVLPLSYGMSLEETGKVIGASKGWVCKQRNRFMQGRLAQGADLPARGGRRRQHFTPEQEAALLKPFLRQASVGGILVVGQIKSQLEASLGRSMALSTVYALLHRHNWRKLAPDKQPPKSDPTTQEDFKKTLRQRSPKSSRVGGRASQSA